MINWQELTIDMFVEQLRRVYERTYGDIDKTFGRIVAWSGRLALENIANSDALYHDIDHTIMVSLAGQAIIEGKHLREGGVCLLYTSDAADERSSVDLGGRRIIK